MAFVAAAPFQRARLPLPRFPRLPRLPFRQLLLVAFLAIAGLLAAVALRGVLTMEQLVVQGRQAADRAVELQSAMQRLIDRGVAMERAARQYLVLAEPQLRRAYDEAREEAKLVVVQLEASGLPAEAAAGWRRALEAVDERLPERAAPLVLEDARLAPAFRALEERTEDLAVALRAHTARRNAEVQQALESARIRFAQQVAAGIVVAALAALGFGWWLSRPMRQLERAVLALGANRLDEPVRIDGPSDLRDLGRRLDWLRLRLQELDEDKSRFLRHISHELKTPLAALREGVALLEDGVAGALSDDQKEIARILAHNTRTLQAQIEDLLRFNAAAFDARRLQRQPASLPALVRQAIDEQRLQWQARRLTVTLDVEGDEAAPTLDLDPVQLGTVLGNLLSNAIRFSPVGQTIAWRVSMRPGWAMIDIIDAGPGVAEADRDRIFDPFYRGHTQPEDATRGTGIGLSIVREVVLAHGGRVELLHEGPEHHGTHFRIELPHVPR